MRNVVYPAILCETWDEYRAKIEASATFAEGVQVDVMDGAFVPATTFADMKKIESVKPGSLFFEIHLMVEDPLAHIEKWANVADSYILHRESAPDPMPVIKQVRSMKKEIGIAVSPETPIEDIFPYIDAVDMALIMTVVPGKDGQPYLAAMNEKITALRNRYPRLPIEVDGGVDGETIAGAKGAGANIFVVGSDIWEAEEPREAFLELQCSVMRKS